MIKVPIYNSSGIRINEFTINDDVDFVTGRVQKGKNCYYKGIGVPYRSHSVLTISDENEYEFIEKCDIFYVGFNVIKTSYKNKIGIFQEKYQPFFSDFIGTCGVKEGTILLNSMSFEKSSVEVLDCVNYDKENDQYYYMLNYSCNRKSYLSYEENPKKLRELLDYMIVNDWNFLWDKAAINDISVEGTVTDVADLFISDLLSHKLGTVYSLLHSLMRLNPEKYLRFLHENNLEHQDDRSLVFNAIELLHLNNVDVSEIFKYDTINQVYKNAVMNYIIIGKNCAYCACDLYKDQGEEIKEKYIDLIGKQLIDTVI